MNSITWTVRCPECGEGTTRFTLHEHDPVKHPEGEIGFRCVQCGHKWMEAIPPPES